MVESSSQLIKCMHIYMGQLHGLSHIESIPSVDISSKCLEQLVKLQGLEQLVRLQASGAASNVGTLVWSC